MFHAPVKQLVAEQLLRECDMRNFVPQFIHHSKKGRKQMYIRKAQPKDIPGLNRLLGQVLLVHHQGRPDIFQATGKKYTDEELLRILKDEDRPVFVCADDNDEVAGYAFCILEDHTPDHQMQDILTMYIDDICVDENRRGQHIGSLLYRHVLEYTRSRGCYNVTLNVWECNPGARKFYEACGMKPLKTGMETVL